jgi:hypothetical protein
MYAVRFGPVNSSRLLEAKFYIANKPAPFNVRFMDRDRKLLPIITAGNPDQVGWYSVPIRDDVLKSGSEFYIAMEYTHGEGTSSGFTGIPKLGISGNNENGRSHVVFKEDSSYLWLRPEYVVESYMIRAVLEGEDKDSDSLCDKDEVAYGTSVTNPDSDDDGLRDGDEVQVHGTDPKNADTDGDGLGDGDEVKYGTDPVEADTDNDGLKDGMEFQLGTDPLKLDTDDDGIVDSQEVRLGTNPKLADTDADGLNDGEEVGKYGTNPVTPDSDADGLSDLHEVQRGTDPLSSDTDADFWNDRADPMPLSPIVPNAVLLVGIAVVISAAFAIHVVRGRRQRQYTRVYGDQVARSIQFCQNCGEKVTDQSSFCRTCGARLREP